jgi:hypothetical protein
MLAKLPMTSERSTNRSSKAHFGTNSEASVAEGEVGRRARRECRRDLAWKLTLWAQDELDLLPGLLLEGGDDLSDRLVLLRIIALVPPHHEVRGPRAERRQ